MINSLRDHVSMHVQALPRKSTVDLSCYRWLKNGAASASFTCKNSCKGGRAAIPLGPATSVRFALVATADAPQVRSQPMNTPDPFGVPVGELHLRKQKGSRRNPHIRAARACANPQIPEQIHSAGPVHQHMPAIIGWDPQTMPTAPLRPDA